MTNKYSEGRPNARYYGGNEYIDQVELLCEVSMSLIISPVFAPRVIPPTDCFECASFSHCCVIC